MAALPAELLPAPARRAARPTPVPAPARRPHLRVVAPRRSARYIVSMLVLAAVGIFGSVALNALAAEQSFAARELEAQVGDLTRTADELTVEVTRLESPARLHRTAVRTLGMVRAEQPAFVVLDDMGSKDSGPRSRTMTASATGD